MNKISLLPAILLSFVLVSPSGASTENDKILRSYEYREAKSRHIEAKNIYEQITGYSRQHQSLMRDMDMTASAKIEAGKILKDRQKNAKKMMVSLLAKETAPPRPALFDGTMPKKYSIGFMDNVLAVTRKFDHGKIRYDNLQANMSKVGTGEAYIKIGRKIDNEYLLLSYIFPVDVVYKFRTRESNGRTGHKTARTINPLDSYYNIANGSGTPDLYGNNSARRRSREKADRVNKRKLQLKIDQPIKWGKWSSWNEVEVPHRLTEEMQFAIRGFSDAYEPGVIFDIRLIENTCFYIVGKKVFEIPNGNLVSYLVLEPVDIERLKEDKREWIVDNNK